MNRTIYINNENRESLLNAAKNKSINAIVNEALKQYFKIDSQEDKKEKVAELPKKKETASETLPKPKKETKQNSIDYSGLTLNQIMMLKRKNKA